MPGPLASRFYQVWLNQVWWYCLFVWKEIPFLERCLGWHPAASLQIWERERRFLPLLPNKMSNTSSLSWPPPFIAPHTLPLPSGRKSFYRKKWELLHHFDIKWWNGLLLVQLKSGWSKISPGTALLFPVRTGSTPCTGLASPCY